MKTSHCTADLCVRYPPWAWRGWGEGGWMGVTRTTGPPAGHSVIHKMRPFYRPPSTLAFLLLLFPSVEEKTEIKSGHAKWMMCVGNQFQQLERLVSRWPLCVEYAVYIFLVETLPDNLSVWMDSWCLQMCSAYEKTAPLPQWGSHL